MYYFDLLLAPGSCKWVVLQSNTIKPVKILFYPFWSIKYAGVRFLMCPTNRRISQWSRNRLKKQRILLCITFRSSNHQRGEKVDLNGMIWIALHSRVSGDTQSVFHLIFWFLIEPENNNYRNAFNIQSITIAILWYLLNSESSDIIYFNFF